MRKILLSIVATLFCCGMMASGLDGRWEGKLAISPETGLRLVLNISGADTATPSVTMDSPDQGAYGIPLSIDYLEGDSLSVSMAQLMMSYSGKLTGEAITGVFSQGGLTLPLTLSSNSKTVKRLQTPQSPFPYLTEEVTFPSALDGQKLVGTVSLPEGWSETTPVVVLLTGSGVQNRDEELFEHKPFAVIADYLARNGIGSLRYDDRGFDPASGLSPNPTTAENAKDAEGAADFLRKRGFRHIGLIGHSEGGLIADMLAAQGEGFDFVIEIGGPVVPGDSILVYQNEFALRSAAMPEEYVRMYSDALKGILNSQKEVGAKPFDENDYLIFSPEAGRNPVLAPLARNLKDNFTDLNPWLRYFINYDPMADIGKVSVPMLFLYGENDTQVPPSMNVPVLERVYPQAAVNVYPSLNHLMQHSKTGKVSEYADIEETISPEVLSDIKTFILSIPSR